MNIYFYPCYKIVVSILTTQTEFFTWVMLNEHLAGQNEA